MKADDEEQKLIFSRKELLDAFEEYKKDTITFTGWRCVYKELFTTFVTTVQSIFPRL